MRPGSSTAITAFDLWKHAYGQIKSQEDLADAFHMSHLAIVSIHQWRTRLRKKVKMVKMARAASKYFLVRRMWLQWIEQIEAKGREQLLQKHVLGRKKRAFEGMLTLCQPSTSLIMCTAAWLQKARLTREREQAVEALQRRISGRIMRGALRAWTDRVIALKSRELDIIQNCNMVTLV